MTILHQSGNSVRAASSELSWQEEMRRAIRDPAELCRLLGLDQAAAAGARQGGAAFGLFAPRSFVRRMRPGDPSDPLLLQVLPRAEEADPVPGFVADPLDEFEQQPVPGLLRKYPGRALLVATGVCGVHCRYCFRRHFPYAQANPRGDAWRQAVEAIGRDATLDEVILSGGDPLTLDDSLLAELIQRLEAIPHIRRLRIHTRMPIVIPQRVTPELLQWLAGGRLTPIVVLHANHAQELDETVSAALEPLRRAGALLFNQAVWLRGINATAADQLALSRRLLELCVTPYYLHMLDPVAGAAHFEAEEAAARQAIAELRATLPGYAVPRLAREIPGRPGKEILA